MSVQPGRRTSSSVFRAVTSALVTLALLAIVGVASRHPITGGRAVHGQQGGGFGWFVDLLTGWMALAVGFGLVLYLTALRPAHRRGMFGRTPERTISLFAVIAALIALQLHFHLVHFGRAHPSSVSASPPSLALPRRLQHPPSAGAHLPWPILIGLALAGMVAAVACVRGPRGFGSRVSLASDENEDQDSLVARVISGMAWTSLDDLAREADPRRAVIAAYARMERGMRSAGIPRSAAETPEEYLTRAFSRLPAGQTEAARLTALYVEARFSDHTVVETMRSEAIASLTGLAQALDDWHRAQTVAVVP